MIDVQMREIKRFESDLKTFAKKALPFATNASINKAAFTGRNIAQKIIKGKMIERNNWTRGSVQVDASKTLNIAQQAAFLGSTADYMAVQEFGGGYTAQGSKGRPIATPEASGESSLPRRKLPRRPNKLSAIQLSRAGTSGLSRKAKNRAAVMQAATGRASRYVFLDLGRRAGIYRVSGGKRRPRIRKIWDLSRRSVRIPARPWLKPATDKAAAQLPRYYREALRYQLKRHKVLGYA